MSHSPNDRSDPTQSRPRRRPGMVAGGTLGLVAVGAGAVLALSGTASAQSRHALQAHHGTVVVRVDGGRSYITQNGRLIARYHEGFTIFMAHGPAKVKGPVTCRPEGRPRPTGPKVKVLVGRNGTEMYHGGAGNTGTAGAYHLARCEFYKVSKSGHAGNTGNTGSA
jgi:hypothetical protein